ncbi:MAG: hypothetical protein AAF934_05170 [Bacteroidota bacterium]
MLAHNTILLTPEALGKSRFTRTGFSEFTSSLIYDTFQAITAAMTEQEQNLNELQESTRLSPEEYAQYHLQGGDVDEFIDQNPQLELSFEEARLMLAQQQLNALKAIATRDVPRIKVNSGTIRSSLLFSFSSDENVQQPNGSFMPKATVRPPSINSAEKTWAGSISGAVEINFSITDNTTET